MQYGRSVSNSSSYISTAYFLVLNLHLIYTEQMTTMTLEQLDETLDSLSFDDHLLLMERLAHRIRTYKTRQRSKMDLALEAMANDPDIQREMKQIEREFMVTELDGLPNETW